MEQTRHPGNYSPRVYQEKVEAADGRTLEACSMEPLVETEDIG